MHLPQLCQQAGSRVQQLQQQLQAMLGAGGGASCEAAGSAAWQGLVGEVSGALDRLLSDVAAFDAMYEQVCARGVQGWGARQAAAAWWVWSGVERCLRTHHAVGQAARGRPRLLSHARAHCPSTGAVGVGECEGSAAAAAAAGVAVQPSSARQRSEQPASR